MLSYEIVYRCTPKSNDIVYCTYDDFDLADKKLKELLLTPQNRQMVRLIKVIRVEMPMTSETYNAAFNILRKDVS